MLTESGILVLATRLLESLCDKVLRGKYDRSMTHIFFSSSPRKRHDNAKKLGYLCEFLRRDAPLKRIFTNVKFFLQAILTRKRGYVQYKIPSKLQKYANLPINLKAWTIGLVGGDFVGRLCYSYTICGHFSCWLA